MAVPAVRALTLAVVGLVVGVQADMAIGCGGFVELSPKLMEYVSGGEGGLELDQVSINLLTSGGSVKYTTQCAPNGYYFIPVYETGTFVIEVAETMGLTAAPSHATVKIEEGKECNQGQDINFVFTGVDVAGTVTADAAGDSSCPVGPEGVVMKLEASEGSDDAPATTKSGVGGAYSFPNVAPGTYTVTASHPRWSIQPSRLPFDVGLGVAAKAPTFTVVGYDVSGSIRSEQGAGPDATVYALSHSPITIPSACASFDLTDPPAGLPQDAGRVVCATTAANGAFSFPSLPCGAYTLVPFHRTANTIYEFSPASATVTVTASSVALRSPFSVASLSVTGAISGVPVSMLSSTTVEVDGKVAEVSAHSSTYSVPHLSPGKHTISAKHPHVFFGPAVEVQVSGSTAALPALYASEYHLCGSISITSPPPGLPTLKQRDVVLTGGETGAAALKMRQSTDADGRFCFQVPSGDYVLTPSITTDELAAGLRLHPQTLSVTIASAPVLDATFQQILVAVSGRVECWSQGYHESVTLTLRGKQHPEVVTQVQPDGTFTFEGVIPGDYTILAKAANVCWEEHMVDITVGADGADKDVAFVQAGVKIGMDARAPGTVLAVGEEGMQLELEANAGHSKHCLPGRGEWQLQSHGCVRYQSEGYGPVQPGKTVQLRVDAYKASGRVTLPGGLGGAEAVGLAVTASGGETPPPRLPLQLQSGDEGSEDDSPLVYTWSGWFSPGDRVQVAARSEDNQVLFYPRTVDVEVGQPPAGCPADATTLTGRSGMVMEGQVTPATEGVRVKILNSKKETVASVTTNSKGHYTVDNLYDDVDYTFEAELEGWHCEETDVRGSFKLLPLRTITVAIVLDSGEPLEGTLVSLSGKGYRSNLPTDAQGQLVFADLHISQYFMRPFMKEYVFEPSSYSLDMSASDDTHVEFKARRTAYSAYGVVRSVTGAGQEGVAVVAIALHDKTLREETKTEKNGAYRLRGLIPENSYVITIDVSESSKVGRHSPAEIPVVVKKADQKEHNFLVFPQLVGHDLSGLVNVSDDLRATLRSDEGQEQLMIKLKDAKSKRVVSTRMLDHSLFFTFPMLPTGEYTVTVEGLHLDSQVWAHQPVTERVEIRQAHAHMDLSYTATLVDRHADLESSSSAFSVFVFVLAGVLIYHRERLPEVVEYIKEQIEQQGQPVVKVKKNIKGGEGAVSKDSAKLQKRKRGRKM